MTVRVVVAVVAALALVAAAAPAVEHARERRQAATVRASADRVADAVRALHRRSDPGASLATAPRRTVSVDLPAGASLTVVRDPERLVARRGNGAALARRLPVPVQVCGGGSALRGPTTLAYVETANGPVVVAVRGFIGGDGSTAGHACTPRPRPVDDGPRLPV